MKLRSPHPTSFHSATFSARKPKARLLSLREPHALEKADIVLTSRNVIVASKFSVRKLLRGDAARVPNSEHCEVLGF